MASASSHVTIRITEPVWRQAAQHHSQRIRDLLRPGLTSPDHVLNSGMDRQRRRDRKNATTTMAEETWTALDPKHPVYNFLIEYYGLKGVKGPKRLARWAPNPALLLSSSSLRGDDNRITSNDQLLTTTNTGPQADDRIYNRDEQLQGGVLLEGATQDDVGGLLHLRGATPVNDGICYSPALFFRTPTARSGKMESTSKDPSIPFLWYRSILQQTLTAEPILHCHGLHEWAMQYRPPGAPPPPSAKYQSHLPLRVSQTAINAAVERRGISCTHVDALRYFAPAAGPLNHHGASLQRTDQLRLEQPACVHAHMDLLKMYLKLQPFCDCALLERVLDVALQSRTLDVAASPYDASGYGVDVVPVETVEGRALYRERQVELMTRAEPVRQELLRAYDMFLEMAFEKEHVHDSIELSSTRADPERFAQAEPGGKPWRRSLVTEN